ncbi:MAG TPA: hypothetical protein VJB99_00920 [Patescibacteria group bacterium]|nr:hypothetical protein [Patescibacteria group bacterium]
MKVLVVEDQEAFASVARKYAERDLKCEVVFVSTKAEAEEVLQGGEIGGVILDVFFPATEGGEPDWHNAIILALLLKEKGIPTVFCTSGNHHGEKYREFLKEKKKGLLYDGFPVAEVCCDHKNHKEMAKPWEAAFRLLFLKVEGMNSFDYPYGDNGTATDILRETEETDDRMYKVFKKYGAKRDWRGYYLLDDNWELCLVPRQWDPDFDF